MNKILGARPVFGDDHFAYRTPRWVEVAYCGLQLSIAGVFAYLALSLNGISSLLTVLLWLASGLLILIALRPRPDAAFICFVCDHGGIYFPSSRARAILARSKDVPWLHVPWHNVSDMRIQLLLDETANTMGVVFSVAASPAEEREFLTQHSLSICREAPRSDLGKQCIVGFANYSHGHSDVISSIQRFHTRAPAARVERIDPMIGSRLAGES